MSQSRPFGVRVKSPMLILERSRSAFAVTDSNAPSVSTCDGDTSSFLILERRRDEQPETSILVCDHRTGRRSQLASVGDALLEAPPEKPTFESKEAGKL